jgi:hypothetical protein
LPVREPAAHIFYGAGRVWLTGSGRISAINPASGRVLTRTLDRGVNLTSMAFHDSSAYVADPRQDRVYRFTAGSRIAAHAIAERGGPRAVVTLSGAVQPTNAAKNLIPIIFGGANTSFLAEVSRLHPVIASAGTRAVWVRSGKGLTRITVPPGGTIRRGNNVASRQHFATDTRVRQLAMTTAGGVYVAIQNPHNVRSHRNLLYFSRAALEAHSPRPTASHRGRTAIDLAIDPAGGVVYADGTGKLWRWAPAAK